MWPQNQTAHMNMYVIRHMIGAHENVLIDLIWPWMVLGGCLHWHWLQWYHCTALPHESFTLPSVSFNSAYYIYTTHLEM